jgi:hypothetical protein
MGAARQEEFGQSKRQWLWLTSTPLHSAQIARPRESYKDLGKKTRPTILQQWDAVRLLKLSAPLIPSKAVLPKSKR